MKHLRPLMALGIAALAAVSTSAGWSAPQNHGGRDFSGGTYLTIITNSEETFASRSVITLHADGTMSAIDSGQGGPTYSFTSQQGSWKPNGSHGVVARTINFSFTPGLSGVARTDYEIRFAPDRRSLAGTVTVTVFPLETANFDNAQGSLLGTFTLVGELITP